MHSGDMMTNTNKTRTFRYTVKHRACDNFGAVDYTVTETITEKDGGLFIKTHALGWGEGERVDQSSEKFWPDSSMERAAEYRLSHGYVEIQS